MNVKTVLFAWMLMAALAGLVPPAHAGKIIVKSPDALVPVAQQWAAEYMSKHRQVRIQVSGGGSGAGLAVLQNQTAGLCLAARQISGDELAHCVLALGRRPSEYKVAQEALFILVHTNNPVQELSVAQLAAIFSGRIRNWKAVGGLDAFITVYGQGAASGASELLKEQVLLGSDFAASMQTAPGAAALVQAVARDVKGIGYGSAAGDRSVKVLPIKKDETSPAIVPNEETVLNGAYPLRRYLRFYVNPAWDQGEISAYLDWMRGDEGQKIVEDAGFFRLPKNLRE